MTIPVRLSVPAALSIGAGLVYLYPVYRTRTFENRPGARLWMVLMVDGALWALLYGLALTVFEPGLRGLVEGPLAVTRVAAAALILAFSLEYTGRGDLLRSKWSVGLVGYVVVGGGLYATNSLHGLMWTGYELDPVLGAAAVDYAVQPLMFAVVGTAYLLNTLGVLLVLETVATYGRLYLRQAVAVTLFVTLPTAANVAWLFRVGPTAHLDLTPVTFLPAALLATYGLFRGEMFEVMPATRRIAEDVAIDDIGTGVLVVAPDGRVLDANETAAEMLDVSTGAVLTERLNEFVDVELPLTETERTLRNPTGNGRVFRVAITSMAADEDREAGYTVTFQDITDERLRQQRLQVLNRVLRHNLRNDAGVIRASAAETKERVDGTDLEPATAPLQETIIETSTGLTRTGEKAREIERVLANGDGDRETTVDLARCCERIAGDASDRFPQATVTVEAEGAVHARVDEAVLDLVVSNLVENGIIHHDGDRPRVTVTVSRRPDGGAEIRVSDDGPGIPDYELSVLEAGEEGPLDHGSGVGLWLVSWGVRRLGGEVAFSVTDGTTATVRLPA